MLAMKKRAFTIVELLVVVSIIALLVGILLPAIGKAREQAKLTQSQSNLRNLSSASFTYAAEWNDRQFTLTDDNLTGYGNNLAEALANFQTQTGDSHPSLILGMTPPNSIWFWVNTNYYVPFNFEGDQAGIGWFRAPNVRQFGQYVSGRFYDPVYFAPKDVAVLASVDRCIDAPGEWCHSAAGVPGVNAIYLPSYAFSPAALMAPNVLKVPDAEGPWIDPYSMGAGFRVPSMSQALFPELKGHMFEHHWLQGAYKECNPNVTNGRYDGCEPYYFNHAFNSAPVTAWYDGHIESFGQLQAIKSNTRMEAQTGFGLQHDQTSMPNYFSSIGFDWTESDHYILTTEGIRGRDKTAD
jgi:prepilin-type N-terminal cleavage/methylation domain-containing protein